MSEFETMMAAREWRSITDHDGRSDVVLVRRGSLWTIAHYDGEIWRGEMEADQGLPLTFEPEEYATIDDDWRWRLMED